MITDQSVASTLGKRNPTSQVYDFAFDFNLGLARRDTNNTSRLLECPGLLGLSS